MDWPVDNFLLFFDHVCQLSEYTAKLYNGALYILHGICSVLYVIILYRTKSQLFNSWKLIHKSMSIHFPFFIKMGVIILLKVVQTTIVASRLTINWLEYHKLSFFFIFEVNSQILYIKCIWRIYEFSNHVIFKEIIINDFNLLVGLPVAFVAETYFYPNHPYLSQHPPLLLHPGNDSFHLETILNLQNKNKTCLYCSTLLVFTN